MDKKDKLLNVASFSRHAPFRPAIQLLINAICNLGGLCRYPMQDSSSKLVVWIGFF